MILRYCLRLVIYYLIDTFHKLPKQEGQLTNFIPMNCFSFHTRLLRRAIIHSCEVGGRCSIYIWVITCILPSITFFYLLYASSLLPCNATKNSHIFNLNYSRWAIINYFYYDAFTPETSMSDLTPRRRWSKNSAPKSTCKPPTWNIIF